MKHGQHFGIKQKKAEYKMLCTCSQQLKLNSTTCAYGPWLEIDFQNESRCVRRVGLKKEREMARSFHCPRMLLDLDWESLSSFPLL